MLKYFIISSLFITTAAYAEPFNLHCVATHNLTEVVNNKITISENEKEKAFGQFEGFRFYVSKLSQDVVEVQALIMDEPSRSYATSNLKETGDYVALSIWKNDFLIDVKCTKL